MDDMDMTPSPMMEDAGFASMIGAHPSCPLASSSRFLVPDEERHMIDRRPGEGTQYVRVPSTQPGSIHGHEATQTSNNRPLRRVENIASDPPPSSSSSPSEPPVSNTGGEGRSAWRHQFERSFETTHPNRAHEISIQALNLRAAHLRVEAYRQHEQALRDLAPINLFGVLRPFQRTSSGETQYPEQRQSSPIPRHARPIHWTSSHGHSTTDIGNTGTTTRPNAHHRRPSTPIQTLDNARCVRPPPKESLEMTVKLDCKICMGQVVDTVIMPCGHAALCRWCADIHIPPSADDSTRPADSDIKCPICRMDVQRKFRIYLV